jgi:hypothetical protein
MTTLENLHENIQNKLDLIESLYNIIDTNFNIFSTEYITELSETINKNLQILQKRYEKVEETKYIYDVKSILLLTEYYSLNTDKTTDFNNNTIYHDNIFILTNENLNLTNNDLLELKNIYYNNYYKYKCYNLHTEKKPKSSNPNNKIIKKIYQKFNIFLASEDIYGIFDNFINFLDEFLLNFKHHIFEYSKLDDITFQKIYKKILQLINNYKKTKLIYHIDDIEYDICDCGNKMIIQANTSELLCTKCGSVITLLGSVFENNQFYQQESQKFPHGSYDPNRHCKFWIDRIQAKENTIISESVLNKIRECIKRDKIENWKNISIDQFRLYLKQTKLTKYNDHIPLIKKMITGYIPPQLDHKELHLLFNYFDKATKIYNEIKPKEKSNSLYYPFIIWKLLDLIITPINKKKELLSCIHLQSYETLIDNDKIWYQICKYNDKFVYKPTDKSILD